MCLLFYVLACGLFFRDLCFILLEKRLLQTRLSPAGSLRWPRYRHRSRSASESSSRRQRRRPCTQTHPEVVMFHLT